MDINNLLQTEEGDHSVASINLRWWRVVALVSAIVVVLAVLVLVFVYRAPDDAPTEPQYFTVSEGESIASVTRRLENQRYVRNATVLQTLLRFGYNSNIIAGAYYLEPGDGGLQLARRLAGGEYGRSAQTITIPEGWTNAQIATRLNARLAEDFDSEEFERLASGLEGYLFPDTYTFFPTVTETAVIIEMEENFERRIEPLESQIASSSYSLRDIITMASLIEGEAISEEDRRMVADILWRRLEAGMRLQVDTVFRYINGKNTYELTKDDLQIDSPYNVYRYSGLPPGPISNPGLDSIRATLNPLENEYWFYLTDDEGVFHYAQTLDQHLVNQRRYLNPD